MVTIGIVPTSKVGLTNNPYLDTYTFIDNYVKRINEEDAVSLGLLVNNLKIDEELLDKCDAFLFPGGNKIERYHYQVLKYAIKKKQTCFRYLFRNAGYSFIWIFKR